MSRCNRDVGNQPRFSSALRIIFFNSFHFFLGIRTPVFCCHHFREFVFAFVLKKKSAGCVFEQPFFYLASIKNARFLSFRTRMLLRPRLPASLSQIGAVDLAFRQEWLPVLTADNSVMANFETLPLWSLRRLFPNQTRVLRKKKIDPFLRKPMVEGSRLGSEKRLAKGNREMEEAFVFGIFEPSRGVMARIARENQKRSARCVKSRTVP